MCKKSSPGSGIIDHLLLQYQLKTTPPGIRGKRFLQPFPLYYLGFLETPTSPTLSTIHFMVDRLKDSNYQESDVRNENCGRAGILLCFREGTAPYRGTGHLVGWVPGTT